MYRCSIQSLINLYYFSSYGYYEHITIAPTWLSSSTFDKFFIIVFFLSKHNIDSGMPACSFWEQLATNQRSGDRLCRLEVHIDLVNQLFLQLADSLKKPNDESNKPMKPTMSPVGFNDPLHDLSFQELEHYTDSIRAPRLSSVSSPPII